MKGLPPTEGPAGPPPPAAAVDLGPPDTPRSPSPRPNLAAPHRDPTIQILPGNISRGGLSPASICPRLRGEPGVRAS